MFGWIEELELVDGDEASTALLRDFPHLKRLAHLDLTESGIVVSGVATVLKAPCLEGLRSLNLSCSVFTDEHALALAGLPGLARLEKLWLDNNQLGPEGAAALAASPHLSRLTPCLPSLTQLHLDVRGLSKNTRQRLQTRFGKGGVSG